jgi:TRAP-type C4-dicarboxylate transport system permease small subunit
VASLLGLFAYTVAGVLARYTGWYRLLGADELAGYGMASVFFFGLGHAFRSGSFVRVSFVRARLSDTPALVLDAASYAIAFAVSLILTYYTWQYVFDSYRFHVMSIGVPQVQLYIPQLCMAIGTSNLALQILELTVVRVFQGSDDSVDLHGTAI